MAEKIRLANGFLDHHHHQGHHPDEIAAHLSEIGKNTVDELELLVEYRQMYAAVLADLLVVKENLARLEKDLEGQVDEQLRKQRTRGIQELSD